MNKLLKLSINCGETTCASEPGKFCKYLFTRKFGTLIYCQIFSEIDDRGKPFSLELVDGWTRRHSLCLQHEDK